MNDSLSVCNGYVHVYVCFKQTNVVNVKTITSKHIVTFFAMAYAVKSMSTLFLVKVLQTVSYHGEMLTAI